MTDTLQEIIDRLWIAPDNAEWTPKTDTVSLSDVRQWFKSDDIEVLGFTSALIHDARFRIEPPLTPNEYKGFATHYYGRCLKEDPKSEWADSRYSAGTTLVNVFASLWRDSSVPREVVKELKTWLGRLYAEGDGSLRTCIVTATLEHLFEQKDIREFFSDWKKDPVLAIAHKEASVWYLGGGKTPLGKPPRKHSRK
ncbi:MAG TPA: hypothetical protein VFA68_03770 [Terriglobales bacterium]|nr:hypothetical protein [Terriglobales bacterium]